jgi:SAM-dependent methyltransferase
VDAPLRTVDRELNWKLKGTVFRLIQPLPGRQTLYRLLQRFITGNAFVTINETLLRLHRYQVANYLQGPRGIAVEFGGGRDLITPLLLSQTDATGIHVFDIDRLSSTEQVNNAIRQLRVTEPGEWPEVTDCDADLVRKYRVHYHAPGDARAMGLPDGSVSYICSTSVLEHIPLADIEQILKECARVAANDAIFSHVIDYADHYVYSDSSISLFNFYRFDEREWRWWNPPAHYQNRMRHSDFVQLFERFGLSTLETVISEAPPDSLANVPLAEPFRRYSLRDLLINSAYFVLKAA